MRIFRDLKRCCILDMRLVNGGMMMYRVLAIALCALLFCGACSNLQQNSAVLRSLSVDETDQIIQTSEDHFRAALEKNWDVWVDYYQDDARLMLPRIPVMEGREELLKQAKNLPVIKKFEPMRLELEGRGNLAYILGSYSAEVGEEEPEAKCPEIVLFGSYLEVWRKQSDGHWKISMAIYNSSSAKERGE
jgi:ketosteroid isomerase-like protein